jgi:hypothetical protein
MTFHVYTDTGKVTGPYGSAALAQKWARAAIVEDKRVKVVEVRPVFAGKGPYSRHTEGSFYRSRKDLQQ